MERRVPTFVSELCVTRAEKNRLKRLGIHLESDNSAFVVVPVDANRGQGISIDISNCEDAFQIANQVLVSARDAFWAMQYPYSSANIDPLFSFLQPIEVYADLGVLRKTKNGRKVIRKFDGQGRLTRLFFEDK